MIRPYAGTPYAEGWVELYISPCLCPPMVRTGGHMCVTTSTLWARRADGSWWPCGMKSMHKAAAWLDLVTPRDSWADVCAALDLTPAEAPAAPPQEKP